MEYDELVSYIKVLANRIDNLEKENEWLKQEFSNVKNIKNDKKSDIMDRLKNEKPSFGLKEWIDNLDYKTSLKTVFQEDLLVGIIRLLEKGVNHISILDYENLPLKVFMQKPNVFYMYDENGWHILSTEELYKWLNYITKRFLIEFKSWYIEHEELINRDERMSDKYVEYLQKTLGGLRLSEEGRNHRIKQHICKAIRQ
jgi:hypothetical protein